MGGDRLSLILRCCARKDYAWCVNATLRRSFRPVPDRLTSCPNSTSVAASA